MVSLFFEGSDSITMLGPADYELCGNILRNVRQPVASYDGSNWCLGQEQFASIETMKPAMLQFESSESGAARLGPFDRVSVVGGEIRAGDKGETVLARYMPSFQLWQLRADRSLWHDVRILDADDDTHPG